MSVLRSMLVSGPGRGVSKTPCLKVAARLPSFKSVVTKDASVGTVFVAVVVCVADMLRGFDDYVLGCVALQNAGSRCAESSRFVTEDRLSLGTAWLIWYKIC